MARTHGLVSTYKNGCRCTECRAGRNDYNRERRRLMAYGRWEAFVDAEPARQHARWLLEQGMSLDGIANTYPLVRELIYGRPSQGRLPIQRMRRENADAVLALQPTLDTIANTAQVPIDPYRRRLEALQALGWSRPKIAREMKASVSQIDDTCKPGRTTIPAKWARRIVAVYDRLSMVRPEGHYPDITRKWAASKGYLPPLAFDDEFLDLTDAELAAECARRAELMDTAELVRCYKAAGEGDRSPLIVAGAARYLEVRRTRRKAAA